MTKNNPVVPNWIKSNFNNKVAFVSKSELIIKAEKVYGTFTYDDSLRFNDYVNDLVDSGVFVVRGNLLFKSSDFFKQ